MKGIADAMGLSFNPKLFLTSLKKKKRRHFQSEWAELCSRLPQTDPDITEEEILVEIKAVRTARGAKK